MAKVTINYYNNPISDISEVSAAVAAVIELGWFRSDDITRVIRNRWNDATNQFMVKMACFAPGNPSKIASVEIAY